MYRLILLLYKEFDYVETTYIGVFLKLVYKITLAEVFDVHVNIILDCWKSVLLCYINVRHHVLNHS
jgi:hypothetical protein